MRHSIVAAPLQGPQSRAIAFSIWYQAFCFCFLLVLLVRLPATCIAAALMTAGAHSQSPSGRQALLQIPLSSWLAHGLSFVAADLQQHYAHTDEGKVAVQCVSPSNSCCLQLLLLIPACG
jgi:hypothetical protein